MSSTAAGHSLQQPVVEGIGGKATCRAAIWALVIRITQLLFELFIITRLSQRYSVVEYV